MLLAVLLCVACVALELWLCGFSWWRHALFVLASIALVVLSNVSGFRHWLRSSRFADFVGETLMRVRFDERSRNVLRKLDGTKNSYVIGCHPHGTHCTHMIRMVAFGSALNESLGANLKVVVHCSYLAIPFLNVLYECCGIMPNVQFFMDRVLRSGGSFAVCPDGIDGKWHASLRVTTPALLQSRVIDIHMRSSRRLGFISLAVRNEADLVPMLGVNELQAYEVYSYCLALGRLLFLPLVDHMEVRVGEPISTRGLDYRDRKQMRALADRYYYELALLARPDYTVRLIPHPDDEPVVDVDDDANAERTDAKGE